MTAGEFWKAIYTACAIQNKTHNKLSSSLFYVLFLTLTPQLRKFVSLKIFVVFILFCVQLFQIEQKFRLTLKLRCWYFLLVFWVPHIHWRRINVTVPVLIISININIFIDQRIIITTYNFLRILATSSLFLALVPNTIYINISLKGLSQFNYINQTQQSLTQSE